MASMSDIRRSIRSIESTQQITKAMKMVSASKLRRAQANVIAARPYAEKVQEVLGHLSKNAKGDHDHPLQEVREVKKVAYILLTGDRGLCGGFNSNIIKECERKIKARNEETALIAVGRKGLDYFERRKYNVAESYLGVGDNPTFSTGKEIAERVIKMYTEGEFDEIHLIFNQFRSAMSHIPTDIQLLPIISVEEDEEKETESVKPETVPPVYLYEPSEEEVLSVLLPAYVETQVFRSLLESKASEHGARMTAMSSATDNAAEIIQNMTLTLNRARQAAITTEITEIVSGAAALE